MWTDTTRRQHARSGLALLRTYGDGMRSRLYQLIVEGGAVKGVVTQQVGKPHSIRARLAVLINGAMSPQNMRVAIERWPERYPIDIKDRYINI